MSHRRYGKPVRLPFSPPLPSPPSPFLKAIKPRLALSVHLRSQRRCLFSHSFWPPSFLSASFPHSLFLALPSRPLPHHHELSALFYSSFSFSLPLSIFSSLSSSSSTRDGANCSTRYPQSSLCRAACAFRSTECIG